MSLLNSNKNSENLAVPSMSSASRGEFAFSSQVTQKDPRFSEWLVEKTLFICGVSSIALICLIFLFLFKEAVSFFNTAPPFDLIGKWVYDEWEQKNLFKLVWQSVSVIPKYSLMPLFCGSFLVAFPATLISSVIGIGSAIYLAEIAPASVRETLKPTLELLASIPSVVIGFVMLAVVATYVQGIFHTKFRLNAFVGALGVSLVIIPVVITMSEDALRAVPRELRDASYALGATKWQTIWGTVVPAAVSGISAAVLLGFGRALGETMIVVMSTGNAALVTGNIFSSVRTMTATIASELGSVDQGSEHYFALFLVGAVLFILTFTLNLVAEIIINRMRSRLRM